MYHCTVHVISGSIVIASRWETEAEASIVTFSGLPATCPWGEILESLVLREGAIVSCTYGHDVSMSKILIYFFYKLKEGLFLCF